MNQLTLNCPNCKTDIPASDINMANTLAKCQSCNTVFDFANSGSPTVFSLGSGTYTLIVTHSGNVSLENVIITDPLLDNAMPPVVINLASGDTDTDNELDPSETWTFNATYLVTQIDIDATEVINTATVNADDVVNHSPVNPVSSQTTTYLIEDVTPPNTDNCDVLDATLECDGENNEDMADQWNMDNIIALENCATDACDPNFEVTSNYMFENLISTCGLGGTIDVIYTIT